ncbi:TIP49 C-terminus-domain-containing protein [Infundibulicybe gibba]|nr:TIP49 C-terminus-domain-containing protein [Infundibulicybe gibba]
MKATAQHRRPPTIVYINRPFIAYCTPFPHFDAKVLFCPMVGLEVYGTEVYRPRPSQSFRRATGLRIKETKEVYEGNITGLVPAEAESPLGGYGKTLRLDPAIYEAIMKGNAVVGDVIYVEANMGAVKGDQTRRPRRMTPSPRPVPLPKGDVHKRKELVQDVHFRGSGRGEHAAAGWAGHHERDGESGEERAHGDNRKALHRSWNSR